MRLRLTVILLVLITFQLWYAIGFKDKKEKAHKSYNRNPGNIYPVSKASNNHDQEVQPLVSDYEKKTLEDHQDHRHGIRQDHNKRAHKSYGRNMYPTPKAHNKPDNDIAPWLATYEGKTIKERQAHRHRILNQVCNSTEHKMVNRFPPHILVNEQNKLVFCFIPKVGSARLLRTVLEANQVTLGLPKGNFNPHDLRKLERYGIKQLNTYSKQEQEDIFRTYYKFLFVRHPLLRLKSAHGMFTKVVSRGTRTEENKSIFDITAGLLNGTSWRVKGFPQFDTFLQILSSKWHTLKKAQSARFNNFQDMCLPCYINYDFIGKQEHFSEELNYVLESRLPNAELIPSRIPETNWMELDQLYHNLSKKTVRLFLQRYRNDFHLFNYKY